MRRRDFVTLLISGATAWPLGARGQSSKPLIGFLSTDSRDAGAFRLTPFLKGLSETGYVEGRNVEIEYRWAGEDYDRLKMLAKELVQLRVNVLVAMPNLAAILAAKEATTSTPIVFFSGSEPVEDGLVASLSRPGGNLTGAAVQATEIGPKLLQLLHAAIPTATVVAAIANPRMSHYQIETRSLQMAAQSLKIELHLLNASTPQDFDPVFATLSRLRPGGVVIGADPLFFSQAAQLAVLAARHGLPAIHQRREFAQAGGLISYGASSDEMFRIAGSYTGRILNGEKPADLPVQLPTKFDLRINLRTAKALGVTVPVDLLATADEVIE